MKEINLSELVPNIDNLEEAIVFVSDEMSLEGMKRDLSQDKILVFNASGVEEFKEFVRFIGENFTKSEMFRIIAWCLPMDPEQFKEWFLSRMGSFLGGFNGFV